MSSLALLPLIFFAQVAPAAPAPASQPTSKPAAGDDLESQFGDTVAKDNAEVTANRPAASTSAAPARSGNVLNPEISVIGSFAATWSQKNDPPPFISGDDPAQQGFTAQEVELGFASDVDPYFQMRAFLTIPNLEGLEVEEAYLQTTQLPHSLQLKAGVFRSNMGRNNEQHLHVQDFARRPKMTQLLGDDGLRAPGVQLSYLLPLPWYAVIYGEALTLTPTQLGGDRVTGNVILEQFFDLSDTWSLLVGANAGSLRRGPSGAPGAVDPGREYLVGGDVYLKWKPVNEVNTYAWFAITAEYFGQREATVGPWTGMGYVQGVAQVARRWRVGARADLLGIPEGVLSEQTTVPSLSIAYLPSEFSRLRLTSTWDKDTADPSQRNLFVTLQYEAAIGAHGAHPF